MQFALLLLLVATLAQSTPIRDDLVDIDQDFVMEQAEVLSFMDYVWTQTVTVGSAGEQFNVAIDTMSGLLYFPDKTCHNCDDGEVFDSSLSSTYHDTKKQFQENSPFGMAKGEIGMDTVVLGDNSSRSVTVQRATFGQVKDMEGRLFPGIDGILGLAFGSTAPNGAEPVFETAIRDRAVNAGIFTIWLEDQFATSDCGTHGVIYYGNYDPLHCKLDQKHIYPLSSAHFYQFTVPSVSVGSYTYNVRTQTIIQSMSQYIEAPMSFITKVLSQLGLPANTHLPAVVPCNTKISIGFNFAMGTETVTDLNLVVPADNGTCTLNLIQRGTALRNVEYFALGYPFLRGRCTFFDYTNQKIGFSEAKSHGGEHDATTPSML